MMGKIVGIIIILVALAMILLTGGLLLPIALPLAVFGFVKLGVKI